jgi:hypothetical protein
MVVERVNKRRELLAFWDQAEIRNWIVKIRYGLWDLDREGDEREEGNDLGGGVRRRGLARHRA